MNMRIILLFFCLGFFKGFAQPNIDALLDKLELGEQFLSLNLENNKPLGTTYYAIIPPIYETYIDTVLQAKTDVSISVDIEMITKTIEIKPASYKWIQRTIEDSLVYDYMCSQELNNFEFILLYPSEVDAEYQIIHICPKEQNIYNDYIPIERQRLISQSTIKKLSSKDEILHSNQIVIEVSNGKWSRFKTVDIAVQPEITIRDIQIALNKKGYKCEINGILNSETKAALTQFMKDNSLPTSRFGIEIIWKKLGLQGY